MKKQLLSIVLVTLSFWAGAQTSVTIKEIQEVSITDLQNCNDSSTYIGQTITTVGYVIVPGNQINVTSGSVQGGFRPFAYIVDTANGGAMGNFSALEMMGAYVDGSGNTLPVNDLHDLKQGWMVRVKGKVGRYNGKTQLEPVDNSSITILDVNPAEIKPAKISVSTLNDKNSINQLSTAEAYEASFVELENLTVIGIDEFSGGTRVNLLCEDADGYLVKIADWFLVQKSKNFNTIRSGLGQSTGLFEVPSVGAKLEKVKGIVFHEPNGCFEGGSEHRSYHSGYTLNPFDTSHYEYSLTPPVIADLNRDPAVPTGTDNVAILATVTDNDGSVTEVNLFYTDNQSAASADFTKVQMTLKSGSTSEFTAEIPAFTDGSLIRFYLSAIDDDDNLIYSPQGASKDEDFHFYTVRDNGLSISDIQKVLNSDQNDASPYVGESVTVSGVVTSSTKDYDLGLFHIQDENETEWSGLRLTGNSSLIQYCRNQKIEVTGIIEESFGFTQMQVSEIKDLGEKVNIKPVLVEFTTENLEKYESVLVDFVNTGGKIVTSADPNSFGEFFVSTDPANDRDQSLMVQTGRVNATNASSLWVSLLSDTSYATEDGEVNVPVIAVQNGMSMDTLRGNLFYGFSQYKLLPRNNDDLIGFSETLDATNYPDCFVGIEKISKSNQFEVYPNPMEDKLHVKGIQHADFTIFNIQGQHVLSGKIEKEHIEINTSTLKRGVYLLRINAGSYEQSVKLIK